MGMLDDFKGMLSDNMPNWLPEDQAKKAAARQALMQAGVAMMTSKGGNFVSALGEGLGAGGAGYYGSLQQQQKDQMESAQLRLLQNKDGREQAKSSFFATAFGLPSEQPAPRTGGADAFAKGAAAGSRTGGYDTSYNSMPYSGPEDAEAINGGHAPEGILPLSDMPRMSVPGMPMYGALGPARQGDGSVPQILPRSQLPQKVNPGQAGKQEAARRPANQFPFDLRQVTALKAMYGLDLSGEYKMANEGFKREQGSTYRMPDGSEETYAKLEPGQMQGRDGVISNAVGYVDSVSESEGAKTRATEQARAEYDLLDPTKYIDENGRPIGGTRAGYIRSVRDLPKKQPGAPVKLPSARARGPANFPTVSPAEQQQRDGGRLQILQDELAATTNPIDRAALQREIAGVNRTLGRGAGTQAGGPPRLQSPTEARVQMGTVDTNIKLGQDLNSNWITQTHNPVQAEGRAARATLGQIKTLDNINFQGGWGAQQRATAASMLAILGVKDAEKFATSAQQFQQVAMERNMTMLQAQSGPQTDGDSQRAQQTFVQLSNTPETNKFIAALTAANARIAAQKADYYMKALPLARARGDMTEIDRRWSTVAPSVWSDPGLAKYNKVK